jgi:hypothetical protein
MTTLKLTAAGDMETTGGLVLESDLGEETAQRLRTKFRFFLGEWALNPRVGMPYFQTILGIKNPDLSLVRAVFRRAILDDEGIASVGPIDLDFTTSARALSVSFEAQLIDGTPLTFADFVLEV